MSKSKIESLSSLFRDESEDARAIPLCFLQVCRHSFEYSPKVYTPVLITDDHSGFLNPEEQETTQFLISDRSSGMIFSLSAAPAHTISGFAVSRPWLTRSHHRFSNTG